jgi:hypothetical protein
MKHPACAAGRCEVIVLGLGTTDISADAQNREESPHLPTFYFCGRFAAKTKRLVTSEAKKCLKIGFRRLQIGFLTENFQNYFYPFVLPQNPAAPAKN